MPAIVTGATGFIGKHLVDALRASGDEVRCFVRRPESAPRPAGTREIVVDYRRADLGVDDGVFAGVDAVYHLAGATRAVSDAAFHEANVAVTMRLIDRISRAGVRPRFVFVSSQAAAGPATAATRPVTELDVARPIEAYGRSKLAAERAIAAGSSDLPTTIVRPVAVYGPGDRDFLPILRMVKRGVAIYPGIRHSILNTVYVTDLVDGMIAAAQAPSAIGRTYFLGDAAGTSWEEIYRTIARAMNRPAPREIDLPHMIVRAGGLVGDLIGSVTGAPLLINSSKAALSGPKYWLCSSGAAERDFGFRAGTSLHDAMRATYDWYLHHQWL